MPILPMPIPLQGVSRRTGFQNQPPFTAHTLTNVWAQNAEDGRAVIATRPAFASYTSPTSLPVNMMTQVNLPAPTAFCGSDGGMYRLDSGSWTLVGTGLPSSKQAEAVPFLRDVLVPSTTSVVYRHSTGVVEAIAPLTVGSFPEGCRVAMVYENSVWLMNQIDTPHAIYASRTGDMYDWDFSADDEFSALVGTVDDAGLIIEPIVAAIPLKGRAILAGENSMYLMIGHPLRGGRVDLLSDNVGILGNSAWCKVPGANNEIYFLTKRGLFSIAEGAVQPEVTATSISRDLLPDELLALPFDITDRNIVLRYDTRWNGIILTVYGDDPQSWRFDPVLGGFTRMTLDEYPICGFSYDDLLTNEASGLLFGTDTGIRRFDSSASESIDTEQIYGAQKISESPLSWSTLQRLHMVLGRDTNDDAATVDIYVGPDAETSVNRADSDFTGSSYSTTIGDLRYTRGSCWPQLSGAACAIAIRQTSSTDKVVVEEVNLDVYPSGDNCDVGEQPPIVVVPLDDVELVI